MNLTSATRTPRTLAGLALAVALASTALTAAFPLSGCQRLMRGGQPQPPGALGSGRAGSAMPGGVGTTRGAETRQGGIEPIAVSVVPASVREVSEAIELSGTVVPDAEVKILPRVTGRLLWVVEEWARVDRGQEIARIETPELAWQLEQARAAVGTARAGLDVARANLANARDMAGRVDLQFKEGAANEQQRDQAHNALRVASAQVEQARAQVAQAEAGVKVLETQVANARIAAPVSGIVTQRLIDVGGMASPAQPILVIASSGRRLVKAQVSERDLRLIHTGMKAVVSSVAYPESTFDGTLVEIGPALDPASRTVPAKIRLAQADALKFGMSVTVRLRSRGRRGLTVPSSAIQKDGRGHAVFVASGSYARRVEVEVGAHEGGRVEIRSGLKAGDPVIERGGDFLKDGDPIRVAGRQSQ